jgi:hypothetical protein
MTRSSRSVAPLGPLGLTRSRSEVAAELLVRIDLGKAILGRTNSWNDMVSANADLAKWRDYNIELLKILFTTEEIYIEYRRSSLTRRVARSEQDAVRVQLEHPQNESL